jgi:hypothetical protein
MNKFTLFLVGAAAVTSVNAKEKLIILNEGSYNGDNGKISYFEDGAIVSNSWYRDINNSKIGDTPNDIIQVNDELIAIAVNTSNIVQFITPEGKAVTATEDIPNNRYLVSDGKYLYVSSYAHECNTVSGWKDFTKGFVAKIDLSTYKVVDTCEVGYEPDGIALYDGYLFVANTGGYSFSEAHDYESTVSIINADTMKKLRDVDTGKINLYGHVSQSGQYLCIPSCGDYYSVAASTVIFDCKTALQGSDDCFATLNALATYSTTALDGTFYCIGSAYSYLTGGYDISYMTIDPAKVIASNGAEGVTNSLPGDLNSTVDKMSSPFGIYVNPYTGYIYATDAVGYQDGGMLYQFDPNGKLTGSFYVGVNPGHFLALNDPAGVADIYVDGAAADNAIYNLQGMRIVNPVAGQIYIQNRKKFIQK